MRLVYVSDERFPSTHTDTQQMALTMDAMADSGIDVTLIAPKLLKGPYAADQRAAMQRYYQIGDRVRVDFIRTLDPESRELVKTLHPLRAMSSVRRERADLVYTRNAQIALLALALGHRVAFESYRIIDRRFPRLVSLFARASRSARFLGVVTHSKLSGAAFRRAGVPEEKVRVVYNGVSMKQMEPRLDHSAARAACGLPAEGAIVVYAGHVKARKGLPSLAEVAAATPAMHHVWVGGDDDGSPAWGRRCAAEVGASNVTVTGWLTAPEVSPYLYAADALVIPPSSGPLKQHGNTVLPMKVFSYLAAGRAVVAPLLPDISELLIHDDNAWLYERDRVAAAGDALQHVTTDAALSARLGEAALSTAQGLTWHARAKKIRDFLSERLEASR